MTPQELQKENRKLKRCVSDLEAAALHMDSVNETLQEQLEEAMNQLGASEISRDAMARQIQILKTDNAMLSQIVIHVQTKNEILARPIGASVGLTVETKTKPNDDDRKE